MLTWTVAPCAHAALCADTHQPSAVRPHAKHEQECYSLICCSQQIDLWQAVFACTQGRFDCLYMAQLGRPFTTSKRLAKAWSA